MTWIKALNGNVIDVPESLVDGLVAQGHEAFQTEAEARGNPAKSKAAAKKSAAAQTKETSAPSEV